MASRGLGSLTLDLILRMAGFERGMDKAQRTLDKRLRDMDRRAKEFGKVIGVSLGVSIAAAIGGTVVALKGAIDNMDKLRDASIRLGIGVETLSAFQFAAQQTGTDIDALGKGFKLLAKNMADALNPDSGKAQVFDALGIKVTDVTGKLKSFEQIIPEIADKFKQLEDGPTKAALALELFGKSGTELTEFLNQGGQGISALVDRAHELGVAFGEDAANKADQFKDKLAELKAVGSGLAIQVANELLPKLIELTEWAVDFVKDGTNAKRIAEDIADGFGVLASAADFVVKSLRTVNATVRGVTSDMTAFLLTMQAVGKARTFQFGDAKALMDQAALARQMASEQSAAIEKIWTAAGDGARKQQASLFAGVKGNVSGPGLNTSEINRNALNRALGGVKDKTAKAKKSDEEKEAERLKSAYDSLNASLQERVALFGEESEAAKVRYDLENGELAKLTPALAAKLGIDKEALVALAETLDMKKAEADAYEKSMEAAKKEAEEKLRGVEATKNLIDDMKFELSLLSMTNKEREKAIALRYADKNATDEQKQAIADLSDELYKAHEQRAFWDEFQRNLSDAFVDLATGAKSLKDTIKDFFDSMAQYILRSIAEHWAEKIADLFIKSTGTAGAASSGTGSNAGFWTSLIGAFFGGGKASGGPTQAGMFYRVNENGPELLSVGGRDYLMMGSQSGHITPHPAMAGGGLTQVNNFNYRAPYDPRVESQKGAALQAQTQRMLARNR